MKVILRTQTRISEHQNINEVLLEEKCIVFRRDQSNVESICLESEERAGNLFRQIMVLLETATVLVIDCDKCTAASSVNMCNKVYAPIRMK